MVFFGHCDLLAASISINRRIAFLISEVDHINFKDNNKTNT